MHTIQHYTFAIKKETTIKQSYFYRYGNNLHANEKRENKLNARDNG